MFRRCCHTTPGTLCTSIHVVTYKQDNADDSCCNVTAKRQKREKRKLYRNNLVVVYGFVAARKARKRNKSSLFSGAGQTGAQHGNPVSCASPPFLLSLSTHPPSRCSSPLVSPHLLLLSSSLHSPFSISSRQSILEPPQTSSSSLLLLPPVVPSGTSGCNVYSFVIFGTITNNLV